MTQPKRIVVPYIGEKPSASTLAGIKRDGDDAEIVCHELDFDRADENALRLLRMLRVMSEQD